jgi:hypothetical protein
MRRGADVRRRRITLTTMAFRTGSARRDVRELRNPKQMIASQRESRLTLDIPRDEMCARVVKLRTST